MRSKPFYWMGALALIALVLYSCQKDELSETNPTTTENPTTVHEEPEMEITVGETPNDGIHGTSVIGMKELKETMKAKLLLKDIFKETFLQLIINHEFNPAFPSIPRNTDCDPSGNGICEGAGPNNQDLMICGCPGDNTTFLSSNPTPANPGPAMVELSYRRGDDCSPCSLALDPGSNRTIQGNLLVVFSAPFSDPNHIISIVPQDNFMIDGFSVQASDIQIQYDAANSNPSAAVPVSVYNFNAINNLVITDPDGNETTLNNTTPFTNSTLTVLDEGEAHGSLFNAFGLLDDIFRIDIPEEDAISVTCSNGQVVKQYTAPGSALTYDMECSCVANGVVHTVGPNPVDETQEVILTSVHYGFDGSYDVVTGEPSYSGPCDNAILVETHCYCDIPTLNDPNSALVRCTCPNTFEEIDCISSLNP